MDGDVPPRKMVCRSTCGGEENEERPRQLERLEKRIRKKRERKKKRKGSAPA